ncbi:TPA: hypothetical protein QDC03_007359 [Burkholderia cepacia]|uniref:hypothetical protein n=1 Tax=Burkholderia cepacia TaxID=292 RepID=UPI0011B1D068|nr:hypothetical protein [Burkholderia cepacia]HDR9512107.1 hypothetical protein [Burkholderia cepacia]
MSKIASNLSNSNFVIRNRREASDPASAAMQDTDRNEPNLRPVDLSKRKIELKHTSSEYGAELRKVRGWLDELSRNEEFVNMARQRGYDPDTVALNTHGKLTLRQSDGRGDPVAFQIVPGEGAGNGWSSLASSITTSMFTQYYNIPVSRTGDYAPVKRLLRFYGILPSNPSTVAEVNRAVRAIDVKIADFERDIADHDINGTKEGARDTIGWQKVNSELVGTVAELQDIKEELIKAAAEPKAAHQSSIRSSSSASSNLSLPISKPPSSSIPTLHTLAPDGTHSPNNGGWQNVTFDGDTKSAIKSELSAMRRALPPTTRDTAKVETPFESNSPFGQAYQEAQGKLQEVRIVIGDRDIGSTEIRTIASVDKNGRGKVERIMRDKDGVEYTKLRYEGPILENAADEVQVALRAARQVGGYLSTGRNSELVPVQSLLRFYGIEPADIKTQAQWKMTSDAVGSLIDELEGADSREQWVERADSLNVQKRIFAVGGGEHEISPNKFSMLGQYLSNARSSLKNIANNHNIFNQTPARDSVMHGAPLGDDYTYTPLDATIDTEGNLVIRAEYVGNGDVSNIVVPRKFPRPGAGVIEDKQLRSLRHSVSTFGGLINYVGGIRADQAFNYYNVGKYSLETSEARRSAVSALEEVRAKDRMGERSGSINIDALIDAFDEATILDETRAYLAEKNATSLLEELGKGVIDRKNEAELRKTPYATLQQVLSSPDAAQLTKRLLRALDWAGAKDGDVVSFELQAKLLQKAIALQLEKRAVSSGNGKHTLGYQFDQPDNSGKTYGEIFGDFEQHLLNKNLINSKNSAILATLACRPSLPAEFAVRDIPPGMRFQTSLAWVKFAQGLNVAQNWRPDAIPQMSFGDVVALPDTAAAAIAQQAQQATTDTERQNAQRAQEALDLEKLAPVLDRAVALGILPAKQVGETFSQDDLKRADSSYESEAAGMIKSIETLIQPWRPTRVAIADAALNNAGIDPKQELEYRRTNNNIRHGASATFEFVKITPRDLYLTGEIKNFEYAVHDAKSKTPFDTKSAAIQGLPDIITREEYEVEFFNDINEKKAAFRSRVTSLLYTIPLKDRQAMYSGRVKLFSVTKDPANRSVKGEMGTHGVLMEVKDGDNKFTYEIFPQAGYIRRGVTGDWRPKTHEWSSGVEGFLEKTTPAGALKDDDAYFTTMEWGPYSSIDNIPGTEGVENVTVHKIENLAPPNAKDLARDDSWQSMRDRTIANSVVNKIVFANQDIFLKLFSGDSERQRLLDSRENLLREWDSFIPIWGSIKDSKSKNTLARRFGQAGLLLDFMTLGVPVSGLLRGAAKSGVQSATLGFKAAQSTLSKSLAKYVPKIADELLVIPGLGRTLAKGAIKFTKAAGDQITAGLAQLRRTIPKLDDVYELPRVTNPRTWKPARPGDQLRTVEGIDNVPVRNVGTPAKPEFSVIVPKTGNPFGPRYIDVSGTLTRPTTATGAKPWVTGKGTAALLETSDPATLVVNPKLRVDDLPTGTQNTLTNEGYMNGVIQITEPNKNVRFFVRDGNKFLEVKLGTVDKKTLRLVDPRRREQQNYFTPIKKNEHGQWILNQGVGLRGGAQSYDVPADALNIKLREAANVPDSEHANFIRNEHNFSDTVREDGDPYKIFTEISEDASGNIRDGSYFRNKYTPSEWIFIENKRVTDEAQSNLIGQFYANDVVRRQYKIISDSNGFFGKLPSRIVRKNVDNDATLDLTKNLESDSPELFRVFFEQTQNGKSTKRILDDFGLKPTTVSKVPSEDSRYMDFTVSVELDSAKYPPGMANSPGSGLTPPPPPLTGGGLTLLPPPPTGGGRMPPPPRPRVGGVTSLPPHSEGGTLRIIPSPGPQRPLSDFVEFARPDIPVNDLSIDSLTHTGTLNGRRYVSFGEPPQAYEVIIERMRNVRLHKDGDAAGDFLKYDKTKKIWEVDPNPPVLGPKPRFKNDASPEVNFKPEPDSPKIYRNFNTEPFGRPWNISDHVDVTLIRDKIKEEFPEFGLDVSRIEVDSITSRELAKKTGVPYDPILKNNPAAWTSPEGKIYVASDHPDYVLNGRIDADKVRSTVVHEFIHAASHNHTGLQASGAAERYINYDENFVDFFARNVYSRAYPGMRYKSGYFSGDGSMWLGEMVRFMEASGTMTRNEIKVALFRNPDSLRPLEGSALNDWKRWSDFPS